VRVAAGRASSVKMGDDGGGLLISPDGVAPSQIVGVSAYVIFPCTIKVQKILLAPAHLGSPGKRDVKQLCVCVCVCVLLVVGLISSLHQNCPTHAPHFNSHFPDEYGSAG